MAGRYTVELRIGAGTFGWVFSALDSTLDPPLRVAVKVLRPEHADQPSTRQRFKDRELDLLHRVQQLGPAPNVVSALGSTVCWHRGHPFIVLEFIDGPSLREQLDRQRSFTREEAEQIGLGIARGLAALHAAGIVHRDLKPANICLRGGTKPVIVDLGSATPLEATVGLTATGRAPLTPRYAAPEQLAGRAVDAACDVYALGVILEEMEVSGRLGAIARRCLEREPSQRPSAITVAEEIGALLRVERDGDCRPAVKRVERDGGCRPAVKRVARVFALGVVVWSVNPHQAISTVEPSGWSPVASMHWGRYGHTLTRLASGDVLAVGGYNMTARSFVYAAERYDPVRDQWTITDTTSPRKVHAAILLPGGDVLVAGGLGLEGVLADSARYAPATNTWRIAAPMTAARVWFTVTWLPGRNGVLAAGGRDTRGFSQTGTELYDPEADRWTAAAPMRIARAGHAALWIPSLDRALVLGGGDERGLSQASIEFYDPVTNGWTRATPMSTSRDRFTATLLASGRVLVVGGMSDGTPLASAEIYDLAAERWTEAAPMHKTRYQHAATILADGRVLVVGGAGRSDSEVYDPTVNRWTLVGAPHQDRMEPTMTLLVDSRALVVGGSGANPSASALFDPGSRGPNPRTLPGAAWTLAPPMRTGRFGHQMAIMPDGRVLVVGAPLGTPVNIAEIYDPLANSWAPPILMTAAPPGRYRGTVTQLPNTGEVLIAGGAHIDGSHSSVERYDPVRNTFAPAAPMTTYRQAHTATLLSGGEVLAAGGYGGWLHAETERYDPARNVWTAGARMRVARTHHAAALLQDGRVLIAGGANAQGSLERSCELYDPATDTWTPAMPLISPRLGGTAMLLHDGRMLLAGGYGESTSEIGAEIYDPRTGRWDAAAPMHSPRGGYAVVLLPSGTMLVAGGRRGKSTYLDSVEIYDPGGNTWFDSASMGSARSDATAILLVDGRVLVTGGRCEDRVLPSAEIYTPARD